MLNIKTAAEAKKEWEERAERKVEEAILNAQENWKTECYFYNTHIPPHIVKELRSKGYYVSDEGDFVSWA